MACYLTARTGASTLPPRLQEGKMMRKVMLLLTSMAAAVLLATGVALATSVDELEPNNSIGEEAQNIAADKFSLDSDPNITDSTTVPHATISGTGNWTTDYYSFSVPEAAVSEGKLSVFDLDEASSFRPMLRLYDSEGKEVAFSWDNYSYDGVNLDPGSITRGESYLKYQFTEAGTYYIEVSDWTYGGPIPSPGASYKLHLSIPGVDSAPTVTSTVPENTTTPPTNVLKTADVTATFSEAVQNVNTDTFKLERKIVSKKGTKYVPVAATVTTSDDDTTAVLNPTKDLPKGDYRATITTGVTDTAGNALSAPYTWTFKVSR